MSGLRRTTDRRLERHGSRWVLATVLLAPIAQTAKRLRTVLVSRWWRAQAVRRFQTLGHPALRAMAAHETPWLLAVPTYRRDEWAQMTVSDIRAIQRRSLPSLIHECPELWDTALRLARHDASLWKDLWRWQAASTAVESVPNRNSPSWDDAVRTSVLRALNQLRLEATTSGPIPALARPLGDLLQQLPAQYAPTWGPWEVKPLLRHTDRGVRELGVRLCSAQAAPTT